MLVLAHIDVIRGEGRRRARTDTHAHGHNAQMQRTGRLVREENQNKNQQLTSRLFFITARYKEIVNG